MGDSAIQFEASDLVVSALELWFTISALILPLLPSVSFSPPSPPVAITLGPPLGKILARSWQDKDARLSINTYNNTTPYPSTYLPLLPPYSKYLTTTNSR